MNMETEPRFKMKIMNKKDDSNNLRYNTEYLEGYEDAIMELPESSISSLITRAFVSQTIKKKAIPDIEDILSEALKNLPTIDELYLGFTVKDITTLKAVKLGNIVPGTNLHNFILLLSSTIIPDHTLCRMFTSIVSRELDVTLITNKPIYLSEAVKLTSTIHDFVKYVSSLGCKIENVPMYNRIIDEMIARLKWQETNDGR